MPSERNYQAIAAQNTKNLTSALGFRPAAPSQYIARPTPAPAAPTPAADTNAGGNNGTGQVQYGAVTVDNPVPATPDLSVETLTKTPEYLARERAIAAAMQAFEATQATEAARYNENYNKSLAELGYDPTSNKWDLGELMSSGQRATASGKAYDALRNDFAARGMLQSGAYQAKRGVLSNQLNDQLTAVQQAKVRFGEDQATKLTAQKAQNEQQRQAALEAARQSILNSMGA
ncbi:hypothetical protein [Flavobacterium sp.]|jgi:hypothetical protein|uniref:hypothetical protein n=1 Tax=Flavobacterium sp. TaxID=239 RepID=UPI0037BF7D75